MTSKKILGLALGLALSGTAPAQGPVDENRTLRIDYIFAGNDSRHEIYLEELSSFSGWAGRHTRLDSLPLKGNGRITMTDAASGDVLYRTSFSTLFQEWTGTEEATRVRKAFENVFLLPMPKKTANVTVEIDNLHGQTTASLTHQVDPADILIRKKDKPAPPHQYTHRGGSPEKCIDVAIVAEGYCEAEMAAFYKDAQTATDAILAYEPFRKLAGRFNFVAVGLPSGESGISVPRSGTWKETALGSHFDTFYSERYLTTLRLRQLHDQLTGIPYEHIIILANTDTYGGGGIYNSYTLTAAHHNFFQPVVVHEFGHSFAGLADEYYYDDQFVEYYRPDVEPWEQNITTLANFQKKWKDLLPAGVPVPTPAGNKAPTEIGVYEGGGYQSKGVYRAFPDCRMKTNEYKEFCPVCQRAIERLIHFYTD